MYFAKLFSRFVGKSHAQRSSRRGPRPTRPVVEQLEDRRLLAAMADLTAFRPVTDYIDYRQFKVPEAAETEARLGPGIRINGDDDNANGQPDFYDSSTPAAGDNDLVRVDVAGAGTSLSVSWTGPLLVWTSATKGASVAMGSQVTVGESLWVEYASTVQTVGATLTLLASDGVNNATDSVAFHSFQSVIIAIGGNTQDPQNFGDSRLGTFTMAGKLYEQGYDVHLFAHNQISKTGTGAAYNEVASAVLKRGVTNVAVYGYSWGGGATYELSAGLKANAALQGKFELRYTAYVDGIRHGSISSETRLPVNSTYHDNFYQRKDWLLKGNSVRGAQLNLNVTSTTWGKSLVHTTVDDNAVLQDTLVNRLTTRLNVA